MERGFENFFTVSFVKGAQMDFVLELGQKKF